jgi:hypothetical protein
MPTDRSVEDALRERVARAIARHESPTDSDGMWKSWLLTADAVLAELKQELQPQAEPVAWAFRHSDGTYHDPSASEHSAGMAPLYAAPQPQAGVVEALRPLEEALDAWELTDDNDRQAEAQAELAIIRAARAALAAVKEKDRG